MMVSLYKMGLIISTFFFPKDEDENFLRASEILLSKNIIVPKATRQSAKIFNSLFVAVDALVSIRNIHRKPNQVGLHE